MFGKLPSYALKAMRYLLSSPGVAGSALHISFSELGEIVGQLIGAEDSQWICEAFYEVLARRSSMRSPVLRKSF